VEAVDTSSQILTGVGESPHLPTATGLAPRVDWIDCCRGIGIWLVFFGHVLQSLTRLDLVNIRAPYHLIYAFHMPMFFMMAGFFFKPEDTLLRSTGRLALRRLLPVVFYSVLLLPLWSLGPLIHGQSPWPRIEPELAGYVLGLPELNWVTWFLVCLFVCECMALICLPVIKGRGFQLLFGAICIGLGAQLCTSTAASGHLVGVDSHAWFLCEAVVALGFYAIGHAIYPWLQGMASHTGRALILFVAGMAYTLATFRMNAPTPSFVVMMSASQHGNPMSFALTALAGSLSIWGLSMAIAQAFGSKLLQELGQRSLILLGLNGVFYHFVNPALAMHRPPPDRLGPILVFALLLSVVSLLACWPITNLLQRYVPQLVGQPQRRG
jgi:fucose 4-O-acetylase-like acetyltransferase